MWEKGKQLEEQLKHDASVKRMLVALDVRNLAALAVFGAEEVSTVTASIEKLSALPMVSVHFGTVVACMRSVQQLSPEDITKELPLLQRVTKGTALRKEQEAAYEQTMQRAEACMQELRDKRTEIVHALEPRAAMLNRCAPHYAALLRYTLAAEQGCANWRSYMQRSTSTGERETLSCALSALEQRARQLRNTADIAAEALRMADEQADRLQASVHTMQALTQDSLASLLQLLAEIRDSAKYDRQEKALLAERLVYQQKTVLAGLQELRRLQQSV